MSHEVETMAYAGETPWHGLGKAVSNDLTPEQMRKEAGLDWDVTTRKDYINWKGKSVPSGTVKLVRDSDGKILTSVSPDWNPVSNKQAFDFFSEFVHAGDMEMHTAGSLKDGQIVWALAKIKESFELFKGDQIDSYMLFSNPHRYGHSTSVQMTPIRVVCNNTLTMALHGMQSETSVRVNHRKKFDADQVKALLGIASEKMDTYKSMAEFLGSKKFTKEGMVEYFKEVFPGAGLKKEQEDPVLNELSRNGRLAYDALETQPGAEYAPGSWWQAFNAVTYTVDHLKGRSADTRLTSAWFGSGRNRKMNALQKAVEYAEAA